MGRMAVDARRPKRVLVVGHLPPPLHGMSLATSRFADVLARRTQVLRLATSADRHGRSLRHHVVRLSRTLAIATRIAGAGRGDRLYAGCDAGAGILYVSIVMAVARARRMPRFLHHHSYAYVTRRSGLMALLVRVAGSATVHVFSCDRQGDAFAGRYPGARHRRTVPVTFALDEPSGPSTLRCLTASKPLVLGHFGNLSMAKGVGTAVATLDACLAEGIDAVLHLGGPLVDPDAVVAVAGAVERVGPRLVQHGPLLGRDKDAYLAGLDVFLFPSRYRNESFGLVVAEAMAAATPVIAHVAGCLDAAWVGGAGLVVGHDADYVAVAVRQIQAWVDDPQAHEAAGRTAFQRAHAGWEAGRRGAEDLADLIAGPTRC